MSGHDIENQVTNNSPVHVTVRQDGIGRTGALILAICTGLAIGAAGYSHYASVQSERETRMLEYYLLELDAKVIAAGIKKPEDSIALKLKEKDK